ncbi:methyltransferase [Draconibacterium sp. IB214405]|uniref:tRNA1(Val) (adenine(37)-N6)-methyltransferase n=1 Tax=Draconibacterium sp. IB214405 TaxID=3097352 RepID=UPI002A11CA6A|nr:methyltransferase [Draconibacterium sp. IB214405]MDX8341555.1 methyltransferase [Draconibacterium sp. IB214405]
MGRNKYFQFKQFRIEQERSAMKVGIDGVLLGAWADVNNCKTILDIGTGTGLITLMLAQRSSSKITAIEIEKNAAQEATANVAASEWSYRVDVKQASLQEYAAATMLKFDLIVSNPPFFQNSLKAGNDSRSIARHTDSLPFSVLIELVAHLLSENGRCAFVFPIQAYKEIETLTPLNGLYEIRKTLVKPTEQKAANRVLVEMSKKEAVAATDCLTIYNEDKSWTNEFKRLTHDFYLNF